jgi:uncharacterized protein (TIGR00730 family)
MKQELKRVCVFCGSSSGKSAEYTEAAIALARELVKQNIVLVYGAGNVGLMGEIADTVLAEGGEVIGVIPKFLVKKEVAHKNLSELHVVESMHERKALMSELSDGFIALPGGIGTFEELFEVLTWQQLGVQAKPCGLINTSEYFDHLLNLLEHAVNEKFLKPFHRDMLLVADNAQQILEKLKHYEPALTDKWIDKKHQSTNVL